MKKSERTNAFLPILHDDAKHYKRYLCLVPSIDLNVHVIICGTSSDMFNPKHMFLNPVVLFMYPPTSLHLKFRTIFVMTSTSVVRSFFEESQTLLWFMHVYKTANKCNIASTGINEMRKILWLKHIFMQPSCFLRVLNN